MSLVACHDVVKRFGANTVLDGVSIAIERGEIVAIIGRSGSGKSTLLRCINGLEPIQGGRIVFNGIVVNDPKTNLRAVRQRVGIVFQSYNLFPHLTVERNITLAPTVVKRIALDEARQIAHAVLRQVGLEDKIAAYPDQLSGGQQHRVAIARSLAMHPKIMLFDEITSALDPELIGEVLKVIAELALRGHTNVIVTHELAFAREVADKIVFMDGGKVVEEGVPAEVLDHPQMERTRTFLGRIGEAPARQTSQPKEGAP